IVITDGFKTYNTLNKEGFKHHFTVNHGENEFAKSSMIHTNGIENFWGCVKSAFLNLEVLINQRLICT
ncbi:transposase, partial [bacterium]|nr:transposase [bacterium]